MYPYTHIYSVNNTNCICLMYIAQKVYIIKYYTWCALILVYIYIVYIIFLCPEWLGKSVMILLVCTRAATSIQVKVAV